jgi:hypothetical protein
MGMLWSNDGPYTHLLAQEGLVRHEEELVAVVGQVVATPAPVNPKRMSRAS